MLTFEGGKTYAESLCGNAFGVWVCRLERGEKLTVESTAERHVVFEKIGIVYGACFVFYLEKSKTEKLCRNRGADGDVGGYCTRENYTKACFLAEVLVFYEP